MSENCPECEGKMKVVSKETVVQVPDTNPGFVTVESESLECQKCGEEYLDENMSKRYAQKLEQALAKKKEKV